LQQVKIASFHIPAHTPPPFNWFQNFTITAQKLPKNSSITYITYTVYITVTSLRQSWYKATHLPLSNAKGYERMELCLHKEAKPHIWL